MMHIREARLNDIPQMQIIGHLVKENVLSDPKLVTDEDVADYITRRGKGWVAEVGNKMVGFAIADLQENSIWALFLNPEFEKQGIGKQLQETMLTWYFGQTSEKLWLTTAAGTRAETFYRKSDWQETGRKANDEIIFELTYDEWLHTKNSAQASKPE